MVSVGGKCRTGEIGMSLFLCGSCLNRKSRGVICRIT